LAEERDYLTRHCDHDPTTAIAYELAQEFAERARRRKGRAFDAWLKTQHLSDVHADGRSECYIGVL
jgi:hypothetical protein